MKWRQKAPEFNKYQTQGAYHWRELDPFNFRLYNPRLLARYQTISRAVRHWMEPGQARGLDIGCGDGALYDYLTQPGTAMVGIDYEVLGLRAAQDVLDQPLLSCASANRLPFASQTFDFAVMSELIEHLKVPRLCLAEASRVLKPGGILVVTTPHRDPSGKLHSNQHVQEFDGEDLKNLLGLYFQDVTVLGMCPSHLVRRYTGRSHNARLLRAVIKVLTVLGFNPFARCGPLEGRLSWDHLIAVGEVH